MAAAAAVAEDEDVARVSDQNSKNDESIGGNNSHDEELFNRGAWNIIIITTFVLSPL